MPDWDPVQNAVVMDTKGLMRGTLPIVFVAGACGGEKRVKLPHEINETAPVTSGILDGAEFSIFN